VDGHIRARSWKTKDGFQHTLTEIIANQVFIFEKSEEIKDISSHKQKTPLMWGLIVEIENFVL
jgi:single-stranded DNA-binding protein